MLECVLALSILSIIILALTCSSTAGQQRLSYSDDVVRAIRLAEHLMEEIQCRPYSGSGADRATFHVDDYHGFREEAGELRDFAGTRYNDEDQVFTRSVTVSASTLAVPAFAAAVDGKVVTITVTDSAANREWQLTRFIPEPSS